MQVIIFDDHKWKNFFPITSTRSTGDLRTGILKQRQKITAMLGEEINRVVIDESLVPLYRERHEDWEINVFETGEYTMVNSRFRMDDDILDLIENLPANTKLTCPDGVVAAKCKLSRGEVTMADLDFADLQDKQIEERCLWNYLWEIILANGDNITEDYERFLHDDVTFCEVEPGVTTLNPYRIWLGEDAKIMPGVVIDATEGPVVIDEGAIIHPNAVLTGPLYVGKNSQIKAVARVGEGTSLGPVCKIGGEVEGVIVQGYSNKQHEGFLGHSYLGEWVNLGADTNNSDLKNNYSTVKVYVYGRDEKVDSGETFLGAVIGDHAKTGINCSINTGTVIGVGCNLYGPGLIKDFVPDFSWGTGDSQTEYRIEKFLETAALVKGRRKLDLSECEKELYKNLESRVFDKTRS